MNSDNTLKPFFAPVGIAVIGARSTPGFGYMLPSNLKENGWGDRTYLVNPKGGRLHGMPVYKTLTEIPGKVDLAVVIVPAPAVPGVLTDIGEAGIRQVILMSAGFAETGPEGAALQDESSAIANQYGLKIIGPNCVGVVNTKNRFATTELMPEAFTPGTLAVLAQSGVFGHNLLERFNEYGIAVSKAVTLGNRVVVNEIDALNFFHQDPETRTIVMYIEGSADGRRLRKTLTKISQDKPVIVLKSGRTEQGKTATASHTGSLSGEDELYEGMFAQTGTVRAKTLDDLTVLARVFDTQPPPRGNHLGIITGSGSMGALATDSAIDHGLVIPELSERIINNVKNGAPGWINVKNPLDVGPSGQFPAAFQAMMEDRDIHMILAVIAIPYAAYQRMEMSTTVDEFFFGSKKPIKDQLWPKPFVISVVSHEKLANLFKQSCEPRVPVFASPETATRALAALWRYRRWLNGNH